MRSHGLILELIGASNRGRDVADPKIVKEGGYQPTTDPGPVPESLIRPAGAEEGHDSQLARALAHKDRVRILAVLHEREASPNELAEILDMSLGDVSHQVQVLLSHKVIEIARAEQHRGAIEHFYRPKRWKGQRAAPGAAA